MRVKNTSSTSAVRNHGGTLPGHSPGGGDPRVTAIFRVAGCRYDLLEDGTFVVRVEISGERSHVVVVQSRTNRVGTREVRHLFACGCVFDQGLPPEVANRLLAENSRYHQAAWHVVPASDGGDGVMAMFSACLPAGAGPEDLLGMIGQLARVADRLEEEVTGEDCF